LPEAGIYATKPMHQEYFKKHFIINNIEYKLTKSEIFFSKKGRPDTQESIKLNELDPYYEFTSYFPISTLIWLTLYLSGFLFGLGFIFMGNHPPLNSEQLARMGFAILIFSSCFYSFLYRYVREWRFNYLYKDEIAFKLKQSKKNENELKELVDIISSHIKKADKSSQYIVEQLARYGLLTEREYELLFGKVLENKMSSKVFSSSSEIIHIAERAK
jgi:hypothetical protein